MPVIVEAFSVILRADAVEKRYPGGWVQFREDCPNRTLCADGELIRIGFMAEADAERYIRQLVQLGFRLSECGGDSDLVLTDQNRGFLSPCNWAELGQVDWQEDPAKKVSVCRLVRGCREELVTPDGWRYEGSLLEKNQFLKEGQIPEFMDFLRTENGLDVYCDLNTGKEVYVGRTGKGKGEDDRTPRVYAIRLPEDTDPEKLEACRAYARMMNTLDFSHLETWLAEDICYESQWVFDVMCGKERFSDYIQKKLDAIRREGSRVWAEIAYTDVFGAGPCVILAQGNEDQWIATLLIQMKEEKISKMDMCFIPDPYQCRRTGERPV